MKNSLSAIWKERRINICLCALTVLLCALYAGILSGKTFSPAEGWYSYYAYLINEEGAVPYLDFELLFPPLYTYLIALITKIFGYSIMVLRVFGVMVFAATGAFAYLIFDKLTKKPWLALVGAMLTMSMLQSEVVQVFYDYIRIMDLNVYISIFFFLRYFDKFSAEKETKIRPDINIILGTVFAVLASMYKQSSGLIFLLFCFAFVVFICICLPRKKLLLTQLAAMLGISAVMYGAMFAFVASKGAFKQYIHYNFVSSVDAKGGGSLISVLFGWIPRSSTNLIYGALLLLIPIALFALFVFLSKKYPAQDGDEVGKFALYAKIGLLVLTLVSVITPLVWGGFAKVFTEASGPILMYVAFLFSMLFFAASAFALIFRKRIRIADEQSHYKNIFLSGVIFTLAFSVCTSGGLAESQIALGFAFMPIALMSVISFKRRQIATLALCAVMILQTTYGFSRKVICTYSWWGLSTGELSEQTETCDVPLLKGIKMSGTYATLYNNVYYGVTNNTAPDEEIFVFPHMPVLYLATDRPRATQTAIQWFDVCTDAAIIEDIDTIREKRPKVIVMCTIGDYVMQSHENSFRGGEASGLRVMQDFLDEFLVEEEYELLSKNKIPDGYVVSVWRLLPETK